MSRGRFASLSIGIFSSVAIIILSYLFSQLFADLEVKTYDYRLRMRGSIATHKDIVLIDCDDRSIAALGRWPWRRSIHARMIDILSRAEAKVIAYDIIFSHPTEKKEDEALISAVQAAGNVILPVGVGLGGDYKAEQTGKEIRQFALPGSSIEPGNLLMSGRVLSSLTPLSRSSSRLGHISANRDNDGTIRRVPLIINLDGLPFPAFALSAAASYLDVEPKEINIQPKSIILKKEIEIPVDQRGMMLINFAGRWVDTFKHYSFIDIFKAGESSDSEERLSKLFRGKLCLISNTATGFDIEPIPVEKDYPGGGIHANIVNTILAEKFLREGNGFEGMALLLLIGAVSGILSSNSRRLINCVSSFALSAAYIVTSFVSFIYFGIVLPVISPLLVIFLTSLLESVYKIQAKQLEISDLEIGKDRLASELNSVNSGLIQKETQLASIRNELSLLEGQVKENNKKGREHLEKIAVLERKIGNVMRERDSLENKKRLLDERISDLELEVMPNTALSDTDLEALRKKCASLGIITRNRTMLEIFRKLKKAAKTDSSIMILGESGTGKEVFAKATHRLSPRRDKSLVTVNIPAIPESMIEDELFGHVKGSFTHAIRDRKGKFEEADKGTIFLDEIGEMKLELQSRLLRVLQEREIEQVGENKKIKLDIRVISATNRDIVSEIKEGRFRKDLFSRLNVIQLALPPLRERQEDIEPLAESFLNHFNEKYKKGIKGISKKGMAKLRSYHWQDGNIRDLMHTIERGVVIADGDRIREDDLDLPADDKMSNIKISSEKAKEFFDISGDISFLEVLKKNRFEIGETAAELGLNRGTVASRFKGICFHYLANNGFVIKDASRQIAGSQDKKLSLLAEKKINGYYANLVDTIREFDNAGDAMNECLRKLKNLPQKYHPFVNKIVDRYFRDKKYEGLF